MLNKPPLLMWAGAASMRLFGINPLALRLPVLSAGVLCCVLIYWWLRRSRSMPAAIAGVVLLLWDAVVPLHRPKIYDRCAADVVRRGCNVRHGGRSALGTALDSDRIRRVVGSRGDDQERGGLAAVVDPDGLLGVGRSEGTSTVAKDAGGVRCGGDRGRALAHLSSLWFTGIGSSPSTCDFNCSGQA